MQPLLCGFFVVREETAINIAVACQLLWTEARMHRTVINLKGTGQSETDMIVQALEGQAASGSVRESGGTPRPVVVVFLLSFLLLLLSWCWCWRWWYCCRCGCGCRCRCRWCKPKHASRGPTSLHLSTNVLPFQKRTWILPQSFCPSVSRRGTGSRRTSPGRWSPHSPAGWSSTAPPCWKPCGLPSPKARCSGRRRCTLLQSNFHSVRRIVRRLCVLNYGTRRSSSPRWCSG